MASVFGKLQVSDYLGKYWAGVEAMCAVIIVMTFTSTLRNATADTPEFYSTIVSSALLCVIAWGLADGVFYAWEDTYISKSHRLLVEDSKLENKKPAAISRLREELDDTILGSINETDRENLYERIVAYLSHNQLEKEEKNSLLRALPHYLLGTSLLAAGAGVVVLLPVYFLKQDPTLALHISNVLGVATLFLIGYYRSQEGGFSQKLTSGIVSAMLGVIIAVITILLGG